MQRIVKEKKEYLQKDRSEATRKESEAKQKEEPERVVGGDEKPSEKKGMEIDEQNDKEKVLKESEEVKEKVKEDGHVPEKDEDPIQTENEENGCGIVCSTIYFISLFSC